jgi:hypothetical protein
MEFFERERTIADQTIKLFSLDGVRWFSSKDEAIRKQKAHQAFLREMRKSLKRKTQYFGHAGSK